MSNKIYERYPPKLTEEQEEALLFEIKTWCIQHGLTVRPPPSFIPENQDPTQVLATNAPVTLFPSPFPRSLFEQARAIQKAYNELYAAISNDETWLEEVMKELIDADDFIRNLWSIHQKVKAEGYVQPLSLGMFRSDYMIHDPSPPSPASLKQVEFNTISSSFGGLSSLITDLHTHLLTYPTPSTPLFHPPNPLLTTKTPPPNPAIETLSSALYTAHTAYGPSKSTPPLPLCLLIIVQPSERNIYDQLALTRHLTTTHPGTPIFRLPAPSILTHTTIPASNPSRPLIYTPPSSPTTPYEATTIYLRALYSPTEYTPPIWSARHHLERSSAIKCPSILTHLSGSKKIQQLLSTSPDTLLPRFLPPSTSSSTLSLLPSTFAPMYSLTPHSLGAQIALDPQTASNHVLKPQREGGGNNIYRSAIPPFLRSIPEEEYGLYTLMELIQPPQAAKNTVLRSDGQVVSGEVISELGVFGGIVWRRDLGGGGGVVGEASDGGGGAETSKGEERKMEVLFNREGGWLLRTKSRESDEGGVAAGFSSLDSVVLY
ncbi:MAG: hypothetical protein Q9227_008396 [Pyrenula ochraceoflavens]